MLDASDASKVVVRFNRRARDRIAEKGIGRFIVGQARKRKEEPEAYL